VANAEIATTLGGGGQPFALRGENLTLRAENLLVREDPAPSDGFVAGGELVAVQFHGAVSRWQVKLDAGATWSALVAEDDARALQDLAVGSRVRLAWRRDAAVPLFGNPGVS
jgi:putative spermidine/putrescine transport system ATP-binding protein